METIEGSKDEHSSDNDIQDEDLAMIMRKFKIFMKRKGRFNQKFIKKGKISRDKKKEEGKEKDQGSVCYECKKPGHFRHDCPLLKSSLRKKIKKALFGAWSDDEELSSSSDEVEPTNTANLCLMALEDEEVQSSDSQYEFTFDELMSAFHELMSKFKKTGSRIKTLKGLNENLQKEKDKLLNKNNTLKRELNVLSEN